MMHSNRFGLPVVLTEHARLRMEERGIDAALILDIIESGSLKEAGGPITGSSTISLTAPTTCYA